MSEDKKDFVTICQNGAVLVKNLENHESLQLIDVIHGKKYNDRTFFCNGYVPISPVKSTEEVLVSPNEVSATAELNVDNISVSTKIDDKIPKIVHPTSLQLNHVETSSHNEQFAPVSKFNLDMVCNQFPENEVVVRRHSISLCNRTPPPKSIAAEILNPKLSFTNTSQKIISQIADIQDALSEFEKVPYCSAKEELSDSSASSSSDFLDTQFQSQSSKSKVKKKKKRKIAETSPANKHSPKKRDLRNSPPIDG